ncbi:MAG: Type II secretion system protein F [Holosporales bacterium]
MADFYCYKALDYKNKIVKDFIFIEDKNALYSYLKSKNLKLIKAFVPLGSKIKPFKKQMDHMLFEWFYFLSEFLKANISLLEAFKLLLFKTKNLYFKKILYQIIMDLENGFSFSLALKNHKSVFSPIIIQAVIVAEERNDFLGAFLNIVDHLKWVSSTKKKIAEAVRYPLFLMSFMVGVLVFLNAYLVPELESFLRQTHADASALNAWFWMRENMISFILLGIFLFSIFFFFFFFYRFKKESFFTKIILNMPISHFFIKVNLIRFLKTLSLMTDSNVDFKNSLDFASKEFSIQTFKKGYIDLKQDIINGELLSTAFSRLIFTMPLIVRFIELGESTGELSKNLNFIAHHLQKEIEDNLNKTISYLQPSFIFITGLLLVWMVYAFLGPIYNHIPGLAQ